MTNDQRPAEELPPPTGTLAILAGYLALLAVMWGALYLELLGR